MGQAGAFAIYQTPTGFTAVTNEVQRQILEALEEEDRQLPELVELTGRAKPTLSGIHMKELLNRELVIELPHPTDSRRKIYHLAAARIGSSDIPVDQLRQAVQSYAKTAPTGAGLPLGTAFQVLAAAPKNAAAGVLRAQARALGAESAPRLGGEDARSFAMAFSRFVEEHGLAEHLQIDFEKLRFRCRPGAAVAGVDAARVGLLLAGFAEGAANAKGIPGVSFEADGDDEAFRLQPN